MDKWEYDIVLGSDYEKIIGYPGTTEDEQKNRLLKWLNEKGLEGWELVGRGQQAIIFKRKVKD